MVEAPNAAPTSPSLSAAPMTGTDVAANGDADIAGTTPETMSKQGVSGEGAQDVSAPNAVQQSSGDACLEDGAAPAAPQEGAHNAAVQEVVAHPAAQECPSDALLTLTKSMTRQSFNEHRARLAEIYKQHNPSFMPFIDLMIDKYLGQEDVLCQLVSAKYEKAEDPDEQIARLEAECTCLEPLDTHTSHPDCVKPDLPSTCIPESGASTGSLVLSADTRIVDGKAAEVPEPAIALSCLPLETVEAPASPCISAPQTVEIFNGIGVASAPEDLASREQARAGPLVDVSAELLAVIDTELLGEASGFFDEAGGCPNNGGSSGSTSGVDLASGEDEKVAMQDEDDSDFSDERIAAALTARLQVLQGGSKSGHAPRPPPLPKPSPSPGSRDAPFSVGEQRGNGRYFNNPPPAKHNVGARPPPPKAAKPSWGAPPPLHARKLRAVAEGVTAKSKPPPPLTGTMGGGVAPSLFQQWLAVLKFLTGWNDQRLCANDIIRNDLREHLSDEDIEDAIHVDRLCGTIAPLLADLRRVDAAVVKNFPVDILRGLKVVQISILRIVTFELLREREAKVTGSSVCDKVGASDMNDGATYLASDISSLAKVVQHFRFDRAFSEGLQQLIASIRRQKRVARPGKVGAQNGTASTIAGKVRDNAPALNGNSGSAPPPLKRPRTRS